MDSWHLHGGNDHCVCCPNSCREDCPLRSGEEWVGREGERGAWVGVHSRASGKETYSYVCVLPTYIHR